MARLSIPRSEFGVLREIAELPGSSFSELLSGLKAVEPEVDQIDIAERLSKYVPSLSPSTLRSFLATILSCYRIIGAKGRSAEEIAADIGETIEREAPQGFPTGKKEILQDRLRNLLSVGGSIAVVAKAISVLLDQIATFVVLESSQIYVRFFLNRRT